MKTFSCGYMFFYFTSIQCLVLCMFCIRQFMVIFFKTYYNKTIKNGTALRESAIYKTENGGTKV